MAIFKHIHKSARHQNRAGCTSRQDVMALSRPDLRYKAYHLMISLPVAERATWEKHIDAAIEDIRLRLSSGNYSHGNFQTHS